MASAKVKDVDSNGKIRGITELNKHNFEALDYGLLGGMAFDI